MDKTEQGRIFGALSEYGGGPFSEFLHQPDREKALKPTGVSNNVTVPYTGTFR